MKKILSILSVFVLTFVLIGCGGKNKLYILNWAQYMSDDLITAFEEEFGVTVVVEDTAESNEMMYSRIKNNSQPYDIVIPSDYMIHRLYQEDLLHELDFDKLPNYSEEMFDENLNNLRNNYFEGNKAVSVPYFWGTLGIMYNNAKDGVKEAVEANSWNVFFEQDKLPNDAKVGMYQSNRDAVAAAELYHGKSVNAKDDATLDQAAASLKAFDYYKWGTDDLKEMVAEKNLDVALVYSGDFFDVLYNYLDNEKEITFDMYVPDTNNVWFDAMAIPTTSKNVDLAHQFINFMLDFDNALDNAYEVGYCPTIKDVYDEIVADEEMADVATHPGFYPGNVTSGEVYEYLGEDVYNKMDDIVTQARG